MIAEAVVQGQEIVYAFARLQLAGVLARKTGLVEIAAGQMIVQIDEIALRMIAVAAQVHLLDLGAQLLQIIQVVDVMAVAVNVFGRRQSAGSNARHGFRQTVELNRIVQVLEHLGELLRIGELDQFVVVVRKFSVRDQGKRVSVST